ncbi:cadherin EGF LAG seven-pass G-type receptor 1-like isoform X2 [Dysidea avara]|uniref:cadherin EGF LAG seven-pass G-type receptor 1-like isoform X2 n=1 Tax=Dysidea avara TaxID=196820 RepID=UPI0033262F53
MLFCEKPFLLLVWLLAFEIASALSRKNEGSRAPTVEAVARAIIVLEEQLVNLRCRTVPSDTALTWTFNEMDLPARENYILTGLNHTLTINNSRIEDSGIYGCHIAGTSINDTVRLRVKSVDCLPSIAGGLQWDGQSAGVYISRKCSMNGEWEDIDFSRCTMLMSSYPVIVAQTKLTSNSTVPSINLFKEKVFRYISTVNYEVDDHNITYLSNEPVENAITVAIVATIKRSNENATSGEDDFDPLILNYTLDNTTTLIGFVPYFECDCNNSVQHNTVKNVCVGPGIPPCRMDEDVYMCHQPIYAGNGVKCGLDSDSDGYPDVQLNCEDQHCLEDECPFVYSVTSDGQQDGSLCITTVTSGNFTGCPPDVDDTWFIFWPPTNTGSVATQKCNGNNSVGLVTRQCKDGGTWGRVLGIRNCFSIDFASLQNTSRQLEQFYVGGTDTDELDYTQSTIISDSRSVSRWLRSLTNTTTSLVPTDLNAANDILRAVLSVEANNESGNFYDIAEELSSSFNNLLNDSNKAAYDEYDDNDEGEQEEAQSLLDNIDNFVRLFKLLPGEKRRSLRLSYQNFNVSFDPPDTTHLNSSGGMQFNIGGSQVYIPHASIRHQVSIEEGVQAPVINYVARNLASVLPSAALDNTTTIEGQVISSKISFDPIDLPSDGYVTLTFRLQHPIDGEPRCVFWDSEVNNTGGWSEKGVFLDVENTNSTTVTCITKHLTSFAVLVDSSGTINSIPQVEAKTLSIVSYIGCGISIICLLATIIIILLFRKTIFKAKQHMIHVNLALALLLGLVVFVSGIETASDNKVGCISVTILLHYFFLAAFCWMLCEGIMIYILLVKVFYNGFFKQLPFHIAIGWGLPIPIVAVTAGLSYDHYDDDDICWLPKERGIMWAFLAPVIAIILCNTAVLVLTMYTIFKTSRKRMKNHQITKVEVGKRLLWAAVILLPILGSTWIIGMISVNNNFTGFSWIFTILNSFQGMVIFIFYVVRNEQFKEVVKSRLGMNTKIAGRSSTLKTTSRYRTSKTVSQSTLLCNGKGSNGKPYFTPSQTATKHLVEDQGNYSSSVQSASSSIESGPHSVEEKSAV